MVFEPSGAARLEIPNCIISFTVDDDVSTYAIAIGARFGQPKGGLHRS